ncbi:hypothetical protein GLOTRDRAFT_128418 [Gloeophyllum trabeum ATCC 11539]|uniref:Uncharacterized protein n=1 Tax=Gloeophyllum trabeum (strain ATCC 11539 / FP-39264 / Madison 617) TaxID=670483 RepID=S7RTK9_GLOTA|nr:uncharacterized protein GLOTRDRAFT_128418 [Gloeophyllum trabeum ATCC 11539]EPQ56474.1 hypothetical protein GLOTRDRAFT_128418 [Gloeophyllum trabeum ATCC 11539]
MADLETTDGSSRGYLPVLRALKHLQVVMNDNFFNIASILTALRGLRPPDPPPWAGSAIRQPILRYLPHRYWDSQGQKIPSVLEYKEADLSSKGVSAQEFIQNEKIHRSVLDFVDVKRAFATLVLPSVSAVAQEPLAVASFGGYECSDDPMEDGEAQEGQSLLTQDSFADLRPLLEYYSSRSTSFTDSTSVLSSLSSLFKAEFDYDPQDRPSIAPSSMQSAMSLLPNDEPNENVLSSPSIVSASSIVSGISALFVGDDETSVEVGRSACTQLAPAWSALSGLSSFFDPADDSQDYLDNGLPSSSSLPAMFSLEASFALVVLALAEISVALDTAEDLTDSEESADISHASMEGIQQDAFHAESDDENRSFSVLEEQPVEDPISEVGRQIQDAAQEEVAREIHEKVVDVEHGAEGSVVSAPEEQLAQEVDGKIDFGIQEQEVPTGLGMKEEDAVFLNESSESNFNREVDMQSEAEFAMHEILTDKTPVLEESLESGYTEEIDEKVETQTLLAEHEKLEDQESDEEDYILEQVQVESTTPQGSPPVRQKKRVRFQLEIGIVVPGQDEGASTTPAGRPRRKPRRHMRFQVEVIPPYTGKGKVISTTPEGVPPQQGISHEGQTGTPPGTPHAAQFRAKGKSASCSPISRPSARKVGKKQIANLSLPVFNRKAAARTPGRPQRVVDDVFLLSSDPPVRVRPEHVVDDVFLLSTHLSAQDVPLGPFRPLSKLNRKVKTLRRPEHLSPVPKTSEAASVPRPASPTDDDEESTLTLTEIQDFRLRLEATRTKAFPPPPPVPGWDDDSARSVVEDLSAHARPQECLSNSCVPTQAPVEQEQSVDCGTSGVEVSHAPHLVQRSQRTMVSVDTSVRDAQVQRSPVTPSTSAYNLVYHLLRTPGRSPVKDKMDMDLYPLFPKGWSLYSRPVVDPVDAAPCSRAFSLESPIEFPEMPALFLASDKTAQPVPGVASAAAVDHEPMDTCPIALPSDDNAHPQLDAAVVTIPDSEPMDVLPAEVPAPVLAAMDILVGSLTQLSLGPAGEDGGEDYEMDVEPCCSIIRMRTSALCPCQLHGDPVPMDVDPLCASGCSDIVMVAVSRGPSLNVSLNAMDWTPTEVYGL